MNELTIISVTESETVKFYDIMPYSHRQNHNLYVKCLNLWKTKCLTKDKVTEELNGLSFGSFLSFQSKSTGEARISKVQKPMFWKQKLSSESLIHSYLKSTKNMTKARELNTHKLFDKFSSSKAQKLLFQKYELCSKSSSAKSSNNLVTSRASKVQIFWWKLEKTQIIWERSSLKSTNYFIKTQVSKAGIIWP